MSNSITLYRYLVSYGCVEAMRLTVISESEKRYECCYGQGLTRRRLLKADDGIAVLKDATHYPYIDFFSTSDPSESYAIRKIKDFFVLHGLCEGRVRYIGGT